MKFIVGLGNPGLLYKRTKHNVGYAVVERIAKEHKATIRKRAYHSLVGQVLIGNEEVTLVLPQTYMNLSGRVAAELMRKKARGIEDILIICDDINLKLGRIRMKGRGSSGGQKGIESIIALLGRDDFPRLRIGIATEVHKGDITHYVLSPFKRKELKNASHAITLAKDAALAWVERGLDAAMAEFNARKAGTS